MRFPCIGKAFGGFLRARDYIFKRSQLFRFDALHIGLKEGRCADQDSSRLRLDRFSDFFHIERTRQCDHATATQEWIPKRHGETETVEDRKVRYDLFRGGQEPCCVDLCAIGQNITMCQHDTLRFARTATSKEQAGLKFATLGGDLKYLRE